MHSINVGF